MNRFTLSVLTTVAALFLAACGGGGSGSSSNSNGGGTVATVPYNSTTDTTISGMASKGPISGTATIFFLKADGSKGGVLTSVPVTNGTYSAPIGKYAGPVLIEVTGRFSDEATGQTKTITADAPLRAALANAADTISIAVTPLTELAVQKTGTLTAAHITAGNKLISDIFKIDVTAVQPVEPTSTALSNSSITQSQKDYTLVLAALSQLSATQQDPLFSTTLAGIANSISYNGMTSQTVASFQKAVTDFIANTKNTTGMTATNTTAANLTHINGGTTATYTLTIQGSAAANSIKGIQFEIIVPNGLTVRYDASSVVGDATKGLTSPGIVTLANPLATLSQAPAYDAVFATTSGVLTFGLYSNAGIGTGNLATVICDVLPGWTAPPATAFSVQNVKAVDGNAATISGIGVTVQ
jgi:hypothetical protein